MKYFVGIDLGGTNTKIGILNETRNILIRDEIKTESIKGVDFTLKKIWETVLTLCNEIKISKDNLHGIGIGIPGPVIKKKIVTIFSNFPWEKNLNISEKMEEISGIKTRVENDANLIALGETLYGAGIGYSSSVTIAIGTGIGGGIVIDGNLISGVNGVGGEIGHIKIVKDGKLCGCGQKGCFEAYVSATGIIRETLSRLCINKTNKVYEMIDGDFNKLEAKHIYEAVKLNDTFALDILDYVADYLAVGIGSTLNIINPEILILSGGVAKMGDVLIEQIKIKLEKYSMKGAIENLVIKQGKLGNDAGIKGASAII